MNEMTLRVARAICLGGIRNPATVCTYPQCGCRNATVKAEAAIAAMREPTEAMIEAADKVGIDQDAIDYWRAMVDAALEQT